MSNRNKLIRLFVLLVAAVMLLSGCTASAAGKKNRNRHTATPAVTATPAPEKEKPSGPMEAAQELADYIFEHGELPDNFIRKKEAENRGWKTTYRYVSDLGEGITIGGPEILRGGLLLPGRAAERVPDHLFHGRACMVYGRPLQYVH